MKNNALKFLLFLPVFNIIADLSLYNNRGGIHWGELRAIIELVFVFSVLYKTDIGKKRVTQLMLVFFAYILFLIMISSDFIYAFTQSYLKVFIAHLLFPVTIYYIRDMRSLKKFYQFSFISGIIISINYVISQFYDIGQSVYVEDSFYLGALGAGTVSMLVIPVLTYPILRKLLRGSVNKLLYDILLVIMILFIFLVMKRIAILVLVIGVIIQNIVLVGKSKYFRYVAFVVLVLASLYPFFGGWLEERVNARTQEKNEIQNESRYYETVVVLEELETGTIKHRLFGTEMFNSSRYFEKYFGKERQLHIDYNIFLHGSGIIGLSFYLLILLIIYKDYSKIYQRIENYKQLERGDTYLLLLKASFISIFYANIFLSFSGGIAYLSLKSFYMMNLGAVFGVIYWSYYRKSSVKKIEHSI